MATNGIRLITPTSVAVTGGGSSATINAGGSVTFATAATLSLNGVFSSLYDNYIIDVRNVSNENGRGILMRMRASGSDNSTANSYVYQILDANSTTVSGARTTSNIAVVGGNDDSQRAGTTLYLYGPHLTQPTAGRSVTVDGFNSAYIIDCAFTHNQSTAYDGFTFSIAAGSFTGLVKVYGLVQ